MTAPVTTDPTADLPVIDFVTDIPGLPGMSRCALVSLDDTGALFTLRSLIDPDLRLVVAAPPVLFGDYEVDIDDDTAALLDLVDPADALVLVVVTLGEDLATSTANLLAPIVINTRTRRALQVVLTGTDQPLRAPLLVA
jgi:flagellar assembly factor FliW